MNKYLKGAAAGLLVGSAVALVAMPMMHSGSSPKKRVSRALRSMGDLVEDVGCIFKM